MLCRQFNRRPTFWRSLICLTGGSMLLSGVGFAQDVREAEAHVHGHGVMFVAIDGPQLVLELDVPGMDLVGFEHAPSTPEQEAAIEAVLAALSDPANVVSMPAVSGCEVVAADANLVGVGEMHEHDEAAHEHGEDANDEEAQEHDEEAHAAFEIVYRFICARPDTLNHLMLHYFSHFPGAVTLEVQFVTDAGAGVTIATSDDPAVYLSGAEQ